MKATCYVSKEAVDVGGGGGAGGNLQALPCAGAALAEGLARASRAVGAAQCAPERSSITGLRGISKCIFKYK